MMQVLRHFPSQPCEPLAIAIGNFDGMHLGHQALLKRLVDVAAQQNKVPAVMTFEPHPREFFTPQNAPARLTTLREKLEHFLEAGVQKVLICRFNKEFAEITAEDFMHEVLRKQLNANTILVGEDFRFGARRAGGVTDFRNAGFELIPLPQVNLGDTRVSSTRVREALQAGDLEMAEKLLGRHYSISGKVVHGAKRGRQLGFPTANVHMRHERPALSGVYAVKLDGLDAVGKLGVRPTIGGIQKLSLEVHVLDYDGDLYDQHVHVEFLSKIRGEQKFESLDALKTQIAQDVLTARLFFKQTI